MHRRPTESARPNKNPARVAGWLLAVLIPVAGVLAAPAVEADNGRRVEQHRSERGGSDRERQTERRDIGPARAAAIARDRFGGKVLKVERRGVVYRVKLLLPDGKVKSVYIEAGQ